MIISRCRFFLPVAVAAALATTWPAGAVTLSGSINISASVPPSAGAVFASAIQWLRSSAGSRGQAIDPALAGLAALAQARGEAAAGVFESSEKEVAHLRLAFSEGRISAYALEKGARRLATFSFYDPRLNVLRSELLAELNLSDD